MAVHELNQNPKDDQIALPGWVRRPSLIVQFHIAYLFLMTWVIAELVSKHFTTAGGVSGWYPSAGIGVALLWALGLRHAWLIFPAALFTGVTVWGYDPASAVLTAATKTGCYLGAAALLNHVSPPGRLPTRPMEVGGVIAAIMACAVLTGLTGVGLLTLSGQIPTKEATDAVVGWVIGDTVGMLVTTPLLVMVVAPGLFLATRGPSNEAKLRYARALGVQELISKPTPAVLIVLTAIGLAVLMSLPEQSDPRVYYLGFIALPALSMRYRLAGGLTALLLVSFFAALAVSLGGIDPLNLANLQLIMIALSISTILVGSFAVMRTRIEEWRQTEQRWAEMALRGSGMGRWSWDLATDQIHTDYMLTDAFGYRRDKVMPSRAWWEQRVHPEDVQRNRFELERLLKGKTDIYEAENRMMAADGSWGWYLSQGTVIERDAQGKPTRVAGTHQDITERRELERIRADAEATHRSEQRFRTLADSAPVAIYQTDAKGVLLYVNPAWREMTGLSQTDALYRGAWEIAHQKERSKVQDHWADAIRSQATVAIEHRVVTAAGKSIWMQTQATPMNHNGVLIGYVGTGVDVTPYREAMAMIRDSEARYRTLADHAYDMLWRVNAEAVFTYVSPGVTKLMDYEPEEMVGTNAFDYFHPDDLERVQGKHAALSPDAPEFHDVHRYRRKDGSYIVFEAVGKLVVPEEESDRENEPEPYITGISRDVTQRVESERIQRELEEKLARSQKLDAIGTFATGIAHDFRNSLLAIKASAQSVGRKLDDEHAAQPALATVNDACTQAMQVTQSLLTFARGPGSTKRMTDVAKLIRENDRLLQTVTPAGVELVCEVPDKPVRLMANSGELQQVLLNLVMNARDAIDGQGQIRVSLGLRDDGQAAQLIFSDTGSGMPPEVLNRALEPFYTTKARLKGTGLGLSQVHGIVTDHGGEISLESAPGKGTRITITVPLKNKPTQSTPPPNPKTEAATP